MTEGGGQCILLCLNNHVKGPSHRPARTNTEFGHMKEAILSLTVYQSAGMQNGKKGRKQPLSPHTRLYIDICMRTFIDMRHCLPLILTITTRFLTPTLPFTLTQS